MKHLGTALTLVAVATAGNPAFAAGPPTEISVRACGARLDGATSDRAALQTCVNRAGALTGGGIVTIPAGTLAIRATDAAIRIPRNVTVRGADRERTIIRVLGAGELNGLLTSINPDNVWIEDLTLYGNAQSGTGGTAGAIYFYAPPGGGSAMRNFGTRNVKLANFKQDYWVYTRNDSSRPMQTTLHSRPSCQSFSGNAREPGTIGVPSACFAFRGEVAARGGVIDGVHIVEATGHGEWIKQFAAFWSGVQNFSVEKGSFRDFGARLPANVGSYTLLVYGDDAGKMGARAPTNGKLTDNAIINSRSVGIYSADGVALTVARNTITGQSDTEETTLPKAAIVFVGVKSGAISDNILSGNYGGIFASGAPGGVTAISGNRISSAVANSYGMRIGPSNVSDNSTAINIDNRDISLTGTGSVGIMIESTSASRQTPGLVKVMGGTIVALGADIMTLDRTTNAGVVSAGITLGGGLTLGGAPAIAALVHIGTATPLNIAGLIIDGRKFGAAMRGANLSNATRLNISDLTLESGPSDQMLLTGGASNVPSGAVRRR